MNTHEPKGTIQRVWVRVLYGEDGQEKREVSVTCAQRAQEVPIQECLTCGRCQGLTFDPLDRAGAIVCQLGDAVDATVGAEEFVVRRMATEGPTDAARTRVTEVMAREVVCVSPETSLDTLRELFREQIVTAVPVVDGAMRVLGVVSRLDLLRARSEQENAEVPRLKAKRLERAGMHAIAPGGEVVRDVMSSALFALPTDASIAQVAAVLAFEGVQQVPVVTAEGVLVGMVTTLDLARWIAVREGYVVVRRSTA